MNKVITQINMEQNSLSKIHRSARMAEEMVNVDGSLCVRALTQTLGEIIRGTLAGEIDSNRANVAINGIKTLVRVADAVRRSSDTATPLLRSNDVINVSPDKG